MRDRLDGISVFVEAVESGGFARAADHLALSRSAVGKSIARLEARLGARLFHRTTRSQSLTEDGQIYYERCLRALDELRTGEAMLELGRKEVAGPLKISMPVLFGRHCVAPLLLQIAQENPKLELDLRLSDQVVDVVGAGFDLAIRNGVPGEGSGLRTRRLVSQHKIICAAPEYLAAHGTPRDIAALTEHDALVYWRNDQLFPWLLRDSDNQYREAELTWRLKFDNLEVLVDAAVAGMGIACVPDWLVRDHLDAGRLVLVMEDYPTSALDTYVVWPLTQYLPLRIRLVIDTLVNKLPAAVNARVPALGKTGHDKGH